MTAGRNIHFIAENPQSWSSLLPVAERLMQRADLAAVTLAVSCPPTENCENWRFTSTASEKFFRQFYIPIADANLLPWHIYVLTHVPLLVGVLPSQHFVAVHHGAGFGNAANTLRMYIRATLYCGVSPAEADYIADHTGGPPPAGRFIATGVPRNDRFAAFLDASPAERVAEQRRLKAKLGRAPDKPLVVVSSHWTPDGILRSFGGDILDGLAPLAGNCEIVQIAHPLLWDDPPYDTWDPYTKRPSQEGFSSASIRAALDARHAAGKVKVFYDIDSPDLLMAADLLIGDYSSILIEFSLFDRPMLFYDVPERFFDRKVYELYAGAAVPFRRAAEVAPLVRHALRHPSEKKTGRQRLSAHFNYNVGGATEAVVEAIAGLPIGGAPT